MNATYNWWGDSTGPYHPTKNPTGLGNQASDYVLFKPWLVAYFDYFRKNPVINEPVAFDATYSTMPCNTKPIVSYTWSFGDDNVTITTNPIIVHSFAAQGAYNVTLTLKYEDDTTFTEWAEVYVVKKPYLAVTPQIINAKRLNSIVQVNVTINDLDASQRIIAVQYRIWFNRTLLQYINVTEGPFLKYYASQQPGSLGCMLFTNYDESPPYGPSVIIGVLILPNGTGYWNPPFPEGNGVIATINFKAILQQRGLEKPPLTCALLMSDTDVFDDDGITIPYDTINGIYKMWPTHIADTNFDGKVDLKDYYTVAAAFGSAPGRPEWNPVADINGDLKVDLKDVFIVAQAFGWVDP
ncbi:MAG: PKD domain-containing protein [Candidatus Bathyarchaeota archaeon]|nr:PKD domain-containing protein [Candidatus Bathyarchaeota archaeon]